MKRFFSSKTLLIIIILIIGLNPQAVKSQSKQTNSKKTPFVQLNLPKPPTNRGAPRDRVGAGSRGECPEVSTPLIGLVPIAQLKNSLENSQIVLSKAATEYPTFWFYIPYNLDSINSVKFALVEHETDKQITKIPISNISGTPGIISFTLPKEQPLKPNKYYHWYLSIDCNPQGGEDIALEGLVIFVPPNAEFKKRSYAVATEREKVALYTEQDYWHDAITIIGEARRQRPNDTTLIQDWKALLNNQDLTSVAAQPISPCCKP